MALGPLCYRVRMKLQISQMKEGENPFQFNSLQDGWVKEVIQHVEAQGYDVQGPLRIDVNLTKLEPDYYLRGKLAFAIQQNCARCAESFSLPIEHQFNVALAHISTAKVRGAAALTEEESEEMDVNFFEGNEIDLGPIVEEQFFLSVPYQSLCKSDCKGICQKCGRNRNAGDCGCSQSTKTTPFSVLEGLKFCDDCDAAVYQARRS